MDRYHSQDARNSHRRGFSSRGKMADNPHRAHHPLSDGPHKETRILKKSIYWATLQYILLTEPGNLSELQQLWIVQYSQRLSDEEILRAGRHLEKLLSSSEIRMFHVKDILRVKQSIPWIEAKPPRELVRIGKGYTDKGSLRPFHKRGRQLSEIAFWDVDIQYMLPFDYEVKGEWITADEVKCLVGETLFELVLNQLRQGRFSPDQILNCRYT